MLPSIPACPSFRVSVTAVVDGQLRPRETHAGISPVLFKCLTGEIRQANLSAALGDTAREKNIKSWPWSFRCRYILEETSGRPPGHPHSLPRTCTTITHFCWEKHMHTHTQVTSTHVDTHSSHCFSLILQKIKQLLHVEMPSNFSSFRSEALSSHKHLKRETGVHYTQPRTRRWINTQISLLFIRLYFNVMSVWLTKGASQLAGLYSATVRESESHYTTVKTRLGYILASSLGNPWRGGPIFLSRSSHEIISARRLSEAKTQIINHFLTQI